MSRALARSYLYVPGNRPDRFDQACGAGADAVIVDLETPIKLLRCRSREKREPRALQHFWIPACAGITRNQSFPSQPRI